MTTKNILLGVGAVGLLSWLTYEMIDSKCDSMMQETNLYQETIINDDAQSAQLHDWECDSQINHDWECKYIVEDRYTQEGGSMVHYVDEVIENVDGSITFIGEDGLVTKIPYPYYNIEKNPNKKS